MSESKNMAPPRVFWWFSAVWLAAFFAGLAIVFPLLPLAAAACLVLALTVGYPTYGPLLQWPESRRVTRWWVGATGLSLLALTVDFLMFAMPRPRYSDYLPEEQVLPLQQFIADNSWALHWAASGTAAAAAVAGVFFFHMMMQKLRVFLRELDVQAVH